MRFMHKLYVEFLEEENTIPSIFLMKSSEEICKKLELFLKFLKKIVANHLTCLRGFGTSGELPKKFYQKFQENHQRSFQRNKERTIPEGVGQTSGGIPWRSPG